MSGSSRRNFRKQVSGSREGEARGEEVTIGCIIQVKDRDTGDCILQGSLKAWRAPPELGL